MHPTYQSSLFVACCAAVAAFATAAVKRRGAIVFDKPFHDIVIDAFARFALPYPDEEILPEPEQTFLLGNRWADYGLAVGFAFLFPVIRTVLRRLVFEVGVAWHALVTAHG